MQLLCTAKALCPRFWPENDVQEKNRKEGQQREENKINFPNKSSAKQANKKPRSTLE